MADPITIQARPATPEERRQSLSLVEDQEPDFDYVPALNTGYEFGYQSPFVQNVLNSDKFNGDQKRQILDEFEKGADTWEADRANRIAKTEKAVRGIEDLPLLDSVQSQEVIERITETFNPDRPLLRERFAENFRNSWLGIEEIPTSAGALYRGAEMGLGMSMTIETQKSQIQAIQRELDIREGKIDEAYSSEIWGQFPTEFLKAQQARMESQIPSEEAQVAEANFDGTMKQAFRAGRFSKMPEWEGFREGIASLLGYLGGAASTFESATPMPGAPAATPWLKALVTRAGRSAAASGALSIAAEPVIQDIAARNFVQEGFNYEEGIQRAFLAMFLSGGFSASGDLGGRFFKRFGVDPDDLAGLSTDEVVEQLAKHHNLPEDVVRGDMSRLYKEYAEDVAVRPQDVEVTVNAEGEQVMARPPAPAEMTPEEIAALPTIEAKPADDVVPKARQFTETFAESERTHPALKQGAWREWLRDFYDPLSNKDTLSQAQAAIDEMGESQAYALITNADNLSAAEVAMGHDLMRRAQNRNDLFLLPGLEKALARSGTSQGQAIQALSMWNRMSPEGVLVVAQRKIDEFNKLFPNKKLPDSLSDAQRTELMALAKAANEATDPTEKLYRAALVDMGLNAMTAPTDAMTKARTVRIIAMLSNPKTMIRNVGGNQFLFMANTASEYLDVPIDRGVSFLRRGWTGEGDLSGKQYWTTTLPSWKAKGSGFLEPFRELEQGYKEAFPNKVDGGWKAQLKAQKEALDGALERAAVLGKLTSQNKFEMSAVKDINRWVFDSETGQNIEKMLALALGGPDRAFWWSAVKNSIDKQMRLYSMKNGVSLEAPTNEMVQRAYMEGAKAIFQDENALSRFAHGARKFLNFNPFYISDKIRGKTGSSPTLKFGLGDIILPFAQVPAALASRGLEYTPLNYVNALYKMAETIPVGRWGGHTFDQKGFVEAFSRATTGTTGTVGMGWFLASQGIINSSLDEDPDIRAYQRSMGVSPYQINASALKRKLVSGWMTRLPEAINNPEKLQELLAREEGQDGDILVRYDWAQPLSMPLAMGAELFNQQKQRERGQEATTKETMVDFVDSIKSGVKTMKEMSFLQSLNSFVETYGQQNAWEAIKQSTLRDLPSSFVPTFVNQFEQLDNNVIRDTQGPDEFENSYLRVANRIPEMVEEMGFPPRRDIWGEVVRRYPNAEQHTWQNVFLNPALMSTLRNSKTEVGDELLRLYDVTGDRTQYPRRAPWRVKIGDENVTLTPQQRNLYQQFVGRLTRDVFHNLIQSPTYIKKTDEQKARLMGNWIASISLAGKVYLLGEDKMKLKGNTKAILAYKAATEKEAGELFDEENPED